MFSTDSVENGGLLNRCFRPVIPMFSTDSVENGGLLNRCSCQHDTIPNGDVTREQIYIHTPSTGKVGLMHSLMQTNFGAIAEDGFCKHWEYKQFHPLYPTIVSIVTVKHQ